jgi:hypothetical protein
MGGMLGMKERVELDQCTIFKDTVSTGLLSLMAEAEKRGLYSIWAKNTDDCFCRIYVLVVQAPDSTEASERKATRPFHIPERAACLGGLSTLP